MACCLTAPSHYLNQWWLIISEVLWHLWNYCCISQGSMSYIFLSLPSIQCPWVVSQRLLVSGNSSVSKDRQCFRISIHCCWAARRTHSDSEPDESSKMGKQHQYNQFLATYPFELTQIAMYCYDVLSYTVKCHYNACHYNANASLTRSILGSQTAPTSWHALMTVPEWLSTWAKGVKSSRSDRPQRQWHPFVPIQME